MCFSYICMKEEVIKEIIELTKERDKILSQFRKYFGVTDPKFQPISVSQDSDPSKLIITDKFGKEYVYKIPERVIIENKGKEIQIADSSAVVKWIGGEINKLDSINKRLEEL